LIIFAVLTVIFIIILILTHRRSPILGFFVVSYMTLFVLYRNNIVKRLYFWMVNGFIAVLMLMGYFYLSMNDIRFQMVNKVITGEKPLNFHILNRISSSRVGIGTDALNIIKNDIEKGNWINLLMGHGVRSGYYLPHQYSPKNRLKYESIFIISEFIEKGLIGLIAILAIFYYAFKTFLTVRITDSFDLFALGLFVPLLVHLVGSIFTFFWDALLPLYLLLFKIAEVYFDGKPVE